MKTKTIKLLTFEELNKEQKEKVLDHYRNFNTENLDFNEEYIDLIENDIIPYFDFEKIEYDLSYSQGSGCRIVINNIKSKSVNLIYTSKHKHYRFLKRLLDNNMFSVEYNLNSSGHHYTHHNTFYLTYNLDCDLTEEKEKIVEKFVDQLEEHLKDKSKELEKYLYSILEDLQSDNMISESLIANEYYFNEETLKIDS